MNGRLAIISPASSAYSETFIQSHRDLNGGDIRFYYGGLGRLKLDGFGKIQSDFSKAFWRVIGGSIGKRKLDITKSFKNSFSANNVKSVLIEYGDFAAEVIPYLDFFKGKIIVHFHGFDASVYDVLESYKTKYLVMFQRVDSIVVVSEKMKDMILAIGEPASKVVLNTYGPHNDFLQVTPSYKADQLLSIGRFVNKKAPYYLVFLMNELIKKFPDLKLIIVGEGELYQTVRDMISFYRLDNNIELKGRQSREEILEIMSNSSCYVQHSVRAIDGDMEGTPNSILEASAAGLAVVSTRHAGIPDVVVEDVTGVLVDEHDVSMMIEAVSKLLQDRTKLEDYGKSGRKRILNEFTQEMYLNKLNKII